MSLRDIKMFAVSRISEGVRLQAREKWEGGERKGAITLLMQAQHRVQMKNGARQIAFVLLFGALAMSAGCGTNSCTLSGVNVSP